MTKYIEGVKPSRLENRKVRHPTVRYHRNMIEQQGVYTLIDCQDRIPKHIRRKGRDIVELIY